MKVIIQNFKNFQFRLFVLLLCLGVVSCDECKIKMSTKPDLKPEKPVEVKEDDNYYVFVLAHGWNVDSTFMNPMQQTLAKLLTESKKKGKVHNSTSRDNQTDGSISDQVNYLKKEIENLLTTDNDILAAIAAKKKVILTTIGHSMGGVVTHDLCATETPQWLQTNNVYKGLGVSIAGPIGGIEILDATDFGNFKAAIADFKNKEIDLPFINSKLLLDTLPGFKELMNEVEKMMQNIDYATNICKGVQDLAKTKRKSAFNTNKPKVDMLYVKAKCNLQQLIIDNKPNLIKDIAGKLGGTVAESAVDTTISNLIDPINQLLNTAIGENDGVVPFSAMDRGAGNANADIKSYSLSHLEVSRNSAVIQDIYNWVIDKCKA